MKDNYIKFVDWKELPLQYFPSKRIERIRWWLVRILGGECPLDTVKIIHIPVEGKNFMEQLWKQKRALVGSFQRKPMELLIGMEDYKELMNCPEVRQEFQVTSHFNYGPDEIYGLKVRVIPWMRGILVMP